MSAAQQPKPDTQSQHDHILERTVHACAVAQGAAAAAAGGFGGGNAEECWRMVKEAEKELDRLDSELDQAITACIGEVTPSQARELLSCMKIAIDLERIGDLLSSVATCGSALGNRIETEDLADLVKMSTVLEKMLTDIQETLTGRNVELAIAVLRTDAEIDRLRNLMMIRHLEQAQIRITHDSVQVLFMAQSLERAGDHVKNVAEEICHLVTGRTLRHLMKQHDVPWEQAYLQWLKKRLDHEPQGKLPVDQIDLP